MDQELRPVEIRDLNKTQLIWLAVLLSFVVSIATGIVTVTLMQQAPTGVTQTINRVVQQTVEKVVPGYTPNTTQTVIVKEDDLVVDAVSKTRANLGSLFTVEDNGFRGAVYSLGSGVFITSAGNIEPSFTYAIKKDKIVYDVKKVSISNDLNLAILYAKNNQGDEKKLESAILGKDSDTKSGQTLVFVSNDFVQKATVQSISVENEKTENGDSISWNVIHINIPLSQISGPAVNLDGALVGFSLENIKGAQIVGIDAIKRFIANPDSLPAPTP